MEISCSKNVITECKLQDIIRGVRKQILVGFHYYPPIRNKFPFVYFHRCLLLNDKSDFLDEGSYVRVKSWKACENES